ncbi:MULTISPECIES: CD3324 family protein [unclassified Fusibacter]|uniref:CD3324 family protein n=1 Tax=unclassified Fusibacter TaxID=2624464 RepID=UPI0010110054|nr:MULTISPECIES: CD3324 family protein [unclassified Fusibacter]MCK8059496.1 CD3324 family protein [Fusibacter sp. A2]NPE21040.1 hypothetical protein [Fusibacter sp. A1]RXV62314.1 hypothetical protein DWB64_04335 [Fusibacter sp. A1]
MSYTNAKQILPDEIIELIQNYVEGEYLYIPKKADNRKAWGENTKTRNELHTRNSSIYKDYIEGLSTAELADKYYLSIKSIQRIVLNLKKSS